MPSFIMWDLVKKHTSHLNVLDTTFMVTSQEHITQLEA